MLSNEVDDARLVLESPSDAEERGRHGQDERYRLNANRRLVSGGPFDRPAPIDDNPVALRRVDPNADYRA